MVKGEGMWVAVRSGDQSLGFQPPNLLLETFDLPSLPSDGVTGLAKPSDSVGQRPPFAMQSSPVTCQAETRTIANRNGWARAATLMVKNSRHWPSFTFC
jgi:hypothetical protein